MKEENYEKELMQERENSCVRKREEVRKSKCAEKPVGPCERVRIQGVGCAQRIMRALGRG